MDHRPGASWNGSTPADRVDLDADTVSHRHDFSRNIAPRGSFLQDLQVSGDGRWVYIADVGFWAKRPAIVVYNTGFQIARRVLNRHESVYPQNILIRNQVKDMSFFGGLLEMKTGIDGVALSRDDAWLYYGAMNHGTLTTLVRDDRIRWADGLSFGPHGRLYLANSAIPILRCRTRPITRHRPPITSGALNRGQVVLRGSKICHCWIRKNDLALLKISGVGGNSP